MNRRSFLGNIVKASAVVAVAPVMVSNIFSDPIAQAVPTEVLPLRSTGGLYYWLQENGDKINKAAMDNWNGDFSKNPLTREAIEFKEFMDQSFIKGTKVA